MIILPPIQFDIELDNPEALEEPEMELVQRAFRRGSMLAAEFIRNLWIEVVRDDPSFHGTGAYLHGLTEEGSITVEKEPTLTGSHFEMVIAITNRAKHASIVEDGHMAFHLPSKIDWGKTTGSIKRSDSGEPYLHIPFTHRAYASPAARQGLLPSTLRAMMPRHIHQQAKELGFTKRKRVGPIYNQKGQFVQADRYTHPSNPAKRRLNRMPGRTGFHSTPTGELYEERRGERVVGRDKHGALRNPEWQSSKWAGLFRTGSPRHSGFMTIRTITPKSEGWNIPAQPGYGFAATTSRLAKRDDRVASLLHMGVMEVLEGRV